VKIRSLIFVFATCLLVPFVVYVSSSSQINIFPVVKKIRIDKNDKSHASFKVRAALDGLNKISLNLPQNIKRRSFDVLMKDDQGNEIAKLDIDEACRFSSRRDYHFDRTVENSKDKIYSVHMHFDDGPVLKEGMNKRKAFRGIAVTLCYRLDLSQVRENFISFKPLNSPILITCLVYLLYAVFIAFILSMIGKDG
jgi:hypothetical protein